MKTVKYDVTYEEKASRLELLIRFLWSIPSYLVLMVLSMVAMIMMVLQFFHMLLLGKRHKAMHEWIMKFMAYEVKWITYVYLLTDERNPILPED